MNPFTTPDKVYISARPQDMRAGIQRLASIVVADFERDPQDGALYCFVSRDCEKIKMLRFDSNGWCLFYVRLATGVFSWTHSPETDDPLLTIERRELMWLLDGLDLRVLKAPAPPTAHIIL